MIFADLRSPTLHARFIFFFNDTATTEIYTLSLHDALPISQAASARARCSTSWRRKTSSGSSSHRCCLGDRKSTRLNSSHVKISYAVFCLKKKKKNKDEPINKKKKNKISTEQN